MSQILYNNTNGKNLLQLAVEALDANPGPNKGYWVNARTDSEGTYNSPVTLDKFNAGIIIN